MIWFSMVQGRDWSQSSFVAIEKSWKKANKAIWRFEWLIDELWWDKKASILSAEVHTGQTWCIWTDIELDIFNNALHEEIENRWRSNNMSDK